MWGPYQVSRARGPNGIQSSLRLGQGPRDLRLTDRCSPFKTGGLNSLSAAEYRQNASPCHRRCCATTLIGGLSRGATPHGFEDPCGRVEFRTGPKGPLTQLSINRL